MKVYIASNRENIDTVQYWQKRLRGIGIQITYDWTKDITSNKPEAELTLEEQKRLATNDLLGTSLADIVWLICPKTGGTGCFIEMGYACALQVVDRLKIVVSGELNRSIFLSLADYRTNSDDEAYKYILAQHEARLSDAR